jgi:hypothetical protein
MQSDNPVGTDPTLNERIGELPLVDKSGRSRLVADCANPENAAVGGSISVWQPSIKHNFKGS